MNTEVEIRIVVAIAAVLLLSSILLCVSSLRRDAERSERLGFAWLFMTNLAFLTGAFGLLSHPYFSFWVSAALAISGAHLGIVFGYFAVLAGLGAPTASRWYFGAALLAVFGQAVLGLGLNQIGILLLTSSVINGLLALHVARRIWPLARHFGPEIAALASVPFAAIGTAYLIRLPLLAWGGSATVMTVATLVITFLLAFSALQWAFALIAFRAAQLNRKLEAERVRAEEANRLKSRFLANMSHELRTPLNGVLGMAQALQELVYGQEQRRMVETIRTSGEGLLAILDDILDLSKIEAGKMTLEEAPFHPAEVLTRIVRLHAPQAEAKGLRFSLHCDPALDGLFLGDAHRLTQVLHNLTGNAVKFTETGQIDLRAEAVAGWLRIGVADTGIGMTQAQQASAFDDFVQADVSITRRFGGTGLGMPIAMSLVTMMGGRMGIESAPGQGTRVVLDLPLRPAPAAEPEPDRAPVPEGPGPVLTGLRILVAEDNLTNQLVLTALLRGTGVELTMVGNGREALTAAIAGDFDLFLFDISMPEMDGPTALSQITAAYSVSDRPLPPAAAISANAMPEQLTSYVAAGFAACLPKPVRKPALIDCIAGLTGKAAAEPTGSG